MMSWNPVPALSDGNPRRSKSGLPHRSVDERDLEILRWMYPGGIPPQNPGCWIRSSQGSTRMRSFYVPAGAGSGLSSDYVKMKTLESALPVTNFLSDNWSSWGVDPRT
jgi:hypothetical protein